MKKKVYIPSLNDSIIVKHNLFLGSMGIEYRGENLRKKDYPYSYEVITPKGDKVDVALRRKFVGLDAPELYINGTMFPYISPLKGIDIILAFAPFGMVLLGAIGGVFAALSTLGVLTIARSVENRKYSVILNIVVILFAYLIALLSIPYIMSLFG